jgi:hypothetical protein
MLTRIRRDGEGFVLVVVILSLVVILGLVTAVMSYALGSQTLSRRDQDWNAALAAAEAGIDDYIFHLNQDGSYWQYGNNTVAPTDPRYGPAPPDGNSAFRTWAPVPGEASDAWYRYDRSTAQLSVDGTIRLTVTGRVGNVTRSLDASVRRRNFLDFLYFTDLETTDPALYPTSTNNRNSTWAQTYCAKRYYEGRDIQGRTDFAGDSDASSNDYCTEISFATVDTINGPLHSNDAIRISGNPQFLGDTSDSWKDPAGKRWWGSGSPSFKPGDPEYSDALTMPPSNVDIKNETNPVFVDQPGCLFTGPTAITLRNDGTMDVISPFTQAKNCTWPSNPATSMYGRFTTTRITLPSTGGVVYVQNVPSTMGDPNYTSGCPYSRPAVGGNGGSGTTPNRTQPLGFPQKSDITPSSAGTTPTGYGCRNGDAFLMGALSGRLTVAAENNIMLVGSTTYVNTSTNLLGLVANNYINVYHPVANPDDPVDKVNEVQTITLTAYRSTTTFRLTYNGQQTSSITYGTGPTASTIQTALVNLSNIGSGDVTVTGPNGGPYTVTFVGALGGQDVVMITVQCVTNCTGTPTPSASVVETVKGDAGTVVTCDGTGTVDSYCNLKVPTALFNGTTPGTSTMATAVGTQALKNPSFYAAMVTVQHSTRVQNYQYGTDNGVGTLNITGAIAQKYRGIVGVINTSGYAKNYVYDQRLKYDSPPKFLNPVASAWQVVTWAERKAAYTPTAA